jgi:hypothetical protein
MANSSYEEIHLARMMHEVIHVNPYTWSLVDNNFDITTETYWNDYSKSLLTIPIICMGIGIIAVLGLECFICWRPCCCRHRFDDDGSPTASRSTQTIHRNPTLKQQFAPRIRSLYRSFYVCLILAIATNQVLIFGSYELTKGVHTAQDGINYVKDLFNVLDDYGNDLISDGTDLQQNFQDALTDCPEAQPLYDGMDEYFQYVNEYVDFVSPVPQQCSNADDDLDKWGIHYKNSAIWELYGMIMIVLVLYLVGLLCAKKIVLQLVLHFTALLMLVLFIFCGVEMVLLVCLLK